MVGGKEKGTHRWYNEDPVVSGGQFLPRAVARWRFVDRDIVEWRYLAARV